MWVKNTRFERPQVVSALLPKAADFAAAQPSMSSRPKTVVRELADTGRDELEFCVMETARISDAVCITDFDWELARGARG
jgi:hypothetical protein